LIAAPWDDANETYLVLGRDEGWSTGVSLATADASFHGEDASGDQVVAGVGDVNGDTLDDFLIGAWYDSDGGSHTGQVYLLLGRTEGWSMGSSAGRADASFIGEHENDCLGHGISGGDVDGDGLDDLLLGAHGNTDGGEDAGKVYLVLGQPSGWSMDTRLASADATFIGGEEDSAGWAVAMDGDFDGDGYQDIAIGADGAAGGYGAVFVLHGHAETWDPVTTLADADASFVGEGWGDDAATTLASAGDVDADGYDDLLVGAPGDDEGGNLAGQVYLVRGQAGGWSGAASLSTADTSFLGEAENDQLGTGLDGAGDVDGDGRDDLVLGAPNNDERSTHGQAYLVLGRSSGSGLDTDLATADASFWSEKESWCVGDSVAGAGDVDGDGLDEILVGAYCGAMGMAYLLTEDPGCEDLDHDGSGAAPCGEDCDDTDPSIHPGAAEVLADGVDQDCDGTETCYADGDGDGFRTTEIVTSPDLD